MFTIYWPSGPSSQTIFPFCFTAHDQHIFSSLVFASLLMT